MLSPDCHSIALQTVNTENIMRIYNAPPPPMRSAFEKLQLVGCTWKSYSLSLPENIMLLKSYMLLAIIAIITKEKSAHFHISWLGGRVGSRQHLIN